MEAKNIIPVIFALTAVFYKLLISIYYPLSSTQPDPTEHQPMNNRRTTDEMISKLSPGWNTVKGEICLYGIECSGYMRLNSER